MSKERTETLSRGLVVTLGKICNRVPVGVAFHLRAIGLEFSEVTNAQKLSFWRLITKTDKSGYWRVLPLAEQFLRQGKLLPKKLKLIDGIVTGCESETVDIDYFISRKGVEPFWNKKEHYSQRKPQTKVIEQGVLFV